MSAGLVIAYMCAGVLKRRCSVSHSIPPSLRTLFHAVVKVSGKKRPFVLRIRRQTSFVPKCSTTKTYQHDYELPVYGRLLRFVEGIDMCDVKSWAEPSRREIKMANPSCGLVDVFVRPAKIID
jgi:hypothetical protein